MKIVADQQIPYLHDYFASMGELILKPGRAISSADVEDADILLVRSVTRVDAALLQRSRVRFVGSVTAGADHLDREWLDRQQITYQTAAGFNAPAVARYVEGVLNLLEHHKPGSRKSAAVIGVGHVGKRVAAILKTYGYDIILCDPLRAEAEAEFVSTPLAEIADVDLITLHVPLTFNSRYPTCHFIDAAFLQRQLPGCVLINAARGAVVDTEALLQAGKHLTWCFDVWENEPNIHLSVLEKAWIATPHIAGYSAESKRRGTELIYQAAAGLKDVLHQESIVSVESAALDLLAMTAQLKSVLSSKDGEVAKLFDEMRSQHALTVDSYLK